MFVFHIFSLIICIISLAFCFALCDDKTVKYAYLMLVISLLQFLNVIFVCCGK